jgi:5-(carboxyamino)imidazole ribonucleotide synthase
MDFVWKCAEFGYDGNGVVIGGSTLINLPDVECIAEDMVRSKMN